MPNQLANETSPYLLQHANNPVNWQAWGAAAIEQARGEQKPIFLSVGYSACHWCHVMEHESFEDETIAAMLNEKFVSIKVDREERPDIDQIYMNAVQLLTGRGGWPMSVFLTPDLQPFFGGTYWPPSKRMGMPGFLDVLNAVDDAWRNRREQALAQASELTEHLKDVGEQRSGSMRPLDESLLTAALESLEQAFDYRNGGFGSAPKFPHAMDVQLLLRIWHRTGRQNALEMVQLNLDKMADGGIYDHLGGGFARYSVDERWLVPHFEKMLYDNALLTNCYLDAYAATKNPEYARVAGETLDYICREMTDASGGYHSTEDADSEGVEGKFYVWSPDEIRALLGAEQAERFCYVYDVSEEGNFEGKNILNLRRSIQQSAQLKGWDADQLRQELTQSRRKLYEARCERIRPSCDDKILVSWNALMIDAMARGAVLLNEPRYLASAEAAADFLFRELRRDDGRLLHCWRQGQAKLDAYLDDYAYLIQSLISLYESSFNEVRVDQAVELAEIVLAHFTDRRGGFYFTADDHEELISRNKDLHDNSVPSGNGMAATCLLRLAALTGRNDFREAAEAALQAAVGVMEKAPTAAGQLLIAVDMLLGPYHEIVVTAASHQQKLLDDLRSRFLPNRVVAYRGRESDTRTSEHLAPLFAGKTSVSESPTTYVCHGFQCEAPAVGEDAIRQAWDQL